MQRDLRVLLVNESALVSRALALVLADAGMDVERAHTLEAACGALTSSSHADVVVTSQRLSGRSGHELIAWMRAHRPGIPVLLYTSFIDRAATPSPDAWLEKPAETGALVAQIRALVARS